MTNLIYNVLIIVHNMENVLEVYVYVIRALQVKIALKMPVKSTVKQMVDVICSVSVYAMKDGLENGVNIKLKKKV